MLRIPLIGILHDRIRSTLGRNQSLLCLGSRNRRAASWYPEAVARSLSLFVKRSTVNLNSVQCEPAPNLDNRRLQEDRCCKLGHLVAPQCLYSNVCLPFRMFSPTKLPLAGGNGTVGSEATPPLSHCSLQVFNGRRRLLQCRFPLFLSCVVQFSC